MKNFKLLPIDLRASPVNNNSGTLLLGPGLPKLKINAAQHRYKASKSNNEYNKVYENNGGKLS